MKIIDEYELRKLLIDSERLRRLEAAGVDNWIGYSLAMDGDIDNPSIWKWIDGYLDDILENYNNYQPKEFDNYNYD